MKKLGKRVVSLGLSMALSAAIFVSAGSMALAYTETTGTVATDNVKVRSSASTTSSQVSSLKSGDTIEIVDEETDASSYTWYKIRVNSSEYGYVRSDLVNKKGGSSESEKTETTTTSKTTESNDAQATVTATTATTVDPKSATITEDSVNVRQGAGTSFDSVGKAKKGETVTITGEAQDGDGKTWYQVTLGNGKTGYVRSDLLTVGEAIAADGGESSEGDAEGGEEQDAEAAEGSEEGSESEGESQSQDGVASEAGDGTYSLVYSTDDEGNGVWYLYDNVGGYRVKVNELIEAAKSSDEVSKLNKTNNTYKTVLIILAVVIAALVVGLILLALKLRDSYYEDDEEEEYDRYSKPARKRALPEEDEGIAPRGGRAENKERAARADRDNQDRARAAQRDTSDREVRPQRDARDTRDPREARAPRDARPQDERSVRPQRQPRREEDPAERPVRNRRNAEDFEDDRAQRRAPREDQPRRSAEEAPRRNAEDRPARAPRRNGAEEERTDRRPSYRNADENQAPRENPKRKPKNFIGDEDDFEFEFIDLDDEK